MTRSLTKSPTPTHSPANIRALVTNIAGPGQLPLAPYRRPTSREMFDWAWGQYLDSVGLLEATYGSVDLEWIVLRNPLGQARPGFWTPAFSIDDATADDRRWLQKLIAMYHREGLKVVLFGNQPHRINLGTLADPQIWELTLYNRHIFGNVLANILASVTHHLGADAIGFDSFPKPARTTDGVFGDVDWAMGPRFGVSYLQGLVNRLEDQGVATWAENEPPADSGYHDWPDSMHFAKLGGTIPRGVDDDDPDRPPNDPKDRRDPAEFTDLFRAADVPHDRGWFWLQNSAHDGPPTIDTHYGVMVPTHADWEPTA